MRLERGHALYEGTVWHRRRSPAHRFHQPVSMAWIDLDELDALGHHSRLLSVGRGTPARFCRKDFRGNPSVPLAESAREFIEGELGFRPKGSVHVLANLRTWGWCFNPICVYFLCDQNGEVVAEILDVSNTPWHERHGYAIDRRTEGDISFAKEFHVSPFLPMNLSYDVTSPVPGQQFDLKLVLRNESEVVFEAGFRGKRTEITRSSLWRLLLRVPTQRVSASIYLHALRLWAKRVEFYPHPKKQQFANTEQSKGNERRA